MTRTRVVGNWLQAYREYSKESESPDSYHLWTALSIIASAVRRQVWLDQGIYILFPNMFVVLIGPAGKVMKSTTIRLGRRLLLEVEDVIFMPDSLTREELIRRMAKAGSEEKSSAVTIHSTELSSLIEPSGIKMIQFLTDIYDGDFKWRYSTKGSGRDTIHEPIVNILAGTTPSWVASGMPTDAVSHGFSSRVVFVFEEEPRMNNPRPKKPDPEITKGLAEDLKHIATLQGAFQMSEEANKTYDELYNKIQSSTPTDYRVEGFHWRKARAHLLKVAMLLSIADRDTLEITSRDLHTADKLLQAVQVKMPQAFSAVGKYEHASDLERVLRRIKETGGMAAEEIYNENYAAGDMQQIAGILGMLQQMRKIERVKEDGRTLYKPLN